MIIIRNLRKIYRSKEKTVEALKGVDLTVNQGDFIAVCGRSGAGKSTLLHIIGCLDGDFEGEYTFLGENIKTLSESKKAKLRNRAIGFVLQEYGLINDESVLENVMLPLRFGRHSSEREKKERARAALEKVGSPISRRAVRMKFREDSGSAPQSPARWSPSRTFCWRTSPRARWTQRPRRS